jgi:hypothetical protein
MAPFAVFKKFMAVPHLFGSGRAYLATEPRMAHTRAVKEIEPPVAMECLTP